MLEHEFHIVNDFKDISVITQNWLKFTMRYMSTMDLIAWLGYIICVFRMETYEVIYREQIGQR